MHSSKIHIANGKAMSWPDPATENSKTKGQGFGVTFGEDP